MIVLDDVELAVAMPPELAKTVEDLCRRSVPFSRLEQTPPTLRQICEIARSLTKQQRDRLLLVCKDPQGTGMYSDDHGLGKLSLTYAQVSRGFPFETPTCLGEAVGKVVRWALDAGVMP
jgi:hypothetical protein